MDSLIVDFVTVRPNLCSCHIRVPWRSPHRPVRISWEISWIWLIIQWDMPADFNMVTYEAMTMMSFIWRTIIYTVHHSSLYPIFHRQISSFWMVHPHSITMKNSPETPRCRCCFHCSRHWKCRSPDPTRHGDRWRPAISQFSELTWVNYVNYVTVYIYFDMYMIIMIVNVLI